jgi:hypothetical protein
MYIPAYVAAVLSVAASLCSLVLIAHMPPKQRALPFFRLLGGLFVSDLAGGVLWISESGVARGPRGGGALSCAVWWPLVTACEFSSTLYVCVIVATTVAAFARRAALLRRLGAAGPWLPWLIVAPYVAAAVVWPSPDDKGENCGYGTTLASGLVPCVALRAVRRASPLAAPQRATPVGWRGRGECESVP